MRRNLDFDDDTTLSEINDHFTQRPVPSQPFPRPETFTPMLDNLGGTTTGCACLTSARCSMRRSSNWPSIVAWTGKHLLPPHLSQHAHDVVAEHLADVVVRVVVLDQPADDIRELLGRVLDAVDELDFFELDAAVGGL